MELVGGKAMHRLEVWCLKCTKARVSEAVEIPCYSIFTFSESESLCFSLSSSLLSQARGADDKCL